MKHTGLFPFVHLFPRQGVAETRSLTIRGFPDLPDDDYGLMESYRVEAGCNCRRVMLNVASRRRQTIGEWSCRPSHAAASTSPDRYAATGQFACCAAFRLNAQKTPNVTADMHHR